MKFRSRHAWSAVLVALFALPVLQPDGFPGLEGRVDGWLNWTGRLGIGNPHAWRVAPGGGSGSQREKDLEVIALEQRESYYRLLDELVQRQSLRDALAGVERLPVALEARILRAKDASPRRRSLLVDRGAADGLVEGLAVVQGSRLVGLVQHVDERSARVQLVTDPSFRIEVAVRSQEGVRATAYLRGGDDEALPLRNLRAPTGFVVRRDDSVLTSNGSERVPDGLVVGRVTDADDLEVETLRDVKIRPLFDLDASTTVLVLLPAR